MEECNNKFPVDLVYLWVNGNDPVWKKKRETFTGGISKSDGKDCEGRYVDNEELKFSLRSAELYAPWIRNIFIVTDNQVPQWLDTSDPRVKIIDHKEILPPEALPTFNSTVIEHVLHKIPGLAEHFLYANDDMFFGRSVVPEDFFTVEGLPIVRFNRRPFRKFSLWVKEKILGKPLSNYNITIRKSARMVEKKYGKYIGHKTHHNIDAFRKSDYGHTYDVFKDEIEKTFSHHLRSDEDVQRNLYSYVPVVERRAVVKFVEEKESFRCHIDNDRNLKRLMSSNPLLFCLNDSEYAREDHRRNVRIFLESRFPEKSRFEK